MRDLLLRDRPDIMNTRNIGGFPNDAVYHAEATSLMRWARALGGSLRGQKIEVVGDREICPRCITILPALAQELGDPEVTIGDPFGFRDSFKNGIWKSGRK